MFITTILVVYNKYYDLVSLLKKEVGFIAALDKACATFINRNGVTKMGADAKKCPELLANYAHLLLKKSKMNLEEDELEKNLEDIKKIFVYIEDKDVFEKYYKTRLAERLVRNECCFLNEFSI